MFNQVLNLRALTVSVMKSRQHGQKALKPYKRSPYRLGHETRRDGYRWGPDDGRLLVRRAVRRDDQRPLSPARAGLAAHTDEPPCGGIVRFLGHDGDVSLPLGHQKRTAG